MIHIAEAPASLGDVVDLRGLPGPSTHRPPSVSHAVHRLVERGVLQSLLQTEEGFRPDVDNWARQIRFVRRASGL
jgi:hypothetical protein